jgi:hypothetical protein
MTRTIGILAFATALLAGCYESYFAVPEADRDVFHPADDAGGDTRDRGADAGAEVDAGAGDAEGWDAGDPCPLGVVTGVPCSAEPYCVLPELVCTSCGSNAYVLTTETCYCSSSSRWMCQTPDVDCFGPGDYCDPECTLPPGSCGGDADADADADGDSDAGSDLWRTRAPMITPRGLLSTAALDGKLYAIGGSTDETEPTAWVAVNEVYDPATDSWSVRAPMPTPRGGAQAVAVNGRILVLGGWNDVAGGAQLDTVEEYDPAADRWRPRAPMPAPRARFTAAVVSGLVYAIGGADVVAVNEVYDPVADAWATRAPMPTPRGYLASGIVDGRIYVVGGYPDQPTNEFYDPASNRWRSAPSLPGARAYHGAAVVGGRVHVVGGSVDGSFLGNRSHQILDPTTGVWSTGADLPVGRLGVEDGVEVLDGTLYVVGCSSYDTGGVTGLLHSLTP